MSRAIQLNTTEGLATVTEDDSRFAEYLDEQFDTPVPYGMLLFKGDPAAFRAARDQWLEHLADQRLIGNGVSVVMPCGTIIGGEDQ